MSALRVPAAFINAIAEGGTKAEAIEYLQKVWDEKCALEREAAALEDKSGGWISVSERLPDIDLPVWCWDGNDIYWGCRTEDSDGWLWARSYAGPQYYAGAWTCDDAETDDDYQPTHWKLLPLPPLPKGE